MVEIGCPWALGSCCLAETRRVPPVKHRGCHQEATVVAGPIVACTMMVSWQPSGSRAWGKGPQGLLSLSQHASPCICEHNQHRHCHCHLLSRCCTLDLIVTGLKMNTLESVTCAFQHLFTHAPSLASGSVIDAAKSRGPCCKHNMSSSGLLGQKGKPLLGPLLDTTGIEALSRAVS